MQKKPYLAILNIHQTPSNKHVNLFSDGKQVNFLYGNLIALPLLSLN